MNDTSSLTGIVSDSLSQSQNNVYNEIVANFNASVDKLFETISKSNHEGDPNYTYSKENYTRYSTEDRGDMAEFVAELTKNHVDFAINNSKLNGEYVIEVNNDDQYQNYVNDFFKKKESSISEYEGPSDIRAYHEETNGDARHNASDTGFYFKHFAEIHSAVMALSSATSTITVNDMQTLSVRTDKDFNITDILYTDEKTKEVMSLYVDENDRVFLGNKEVFGKEAKELADSYKYAVESHNTKIKDIQRHYGFNIGENYNAPLEKKLDKAKKELKKDNDFLDDQLKNNKISKEFYDKSKAVNIDNYEQKEKKIKKQMANNDEQYKQMVKELQNTNGANYRMKGGRFIEHISNYQTKSVSEIVKVINEEAHIRRNNLSGNNILDKGDGSRYIKSLEKDFGIKVDSLGKIDEKTLYSIKKTVMERGVTNNILLVNAFGKFNRKAFENLSSEQLKAIGISRDSQNLILKMTKDKYGRDNRVLKSGVMIGLSKVYNQDQDIQELQSNAKNAKSIGDNALKGLRKETDVIKMRIEDHKAKRATKKTDQKSEFKPRNTKKKTPTSKSMTERQKQRQINSAKKDDEKFKKVVNKKPKKENKLYNRFNAIRAKLGQTKVGKLITGTNKAIDAIKKKLATIAGGFVLVYLKISMAAVLVLLVLSFISSLVDGIDKAIKDALSPKDYKGTCAYYLVQAMQELEDDWIYNDLMNYEALWENKENLYYTLKYRSFSSYINDFGSLKIEDGKLVNYPFGNSDGYKEIRVTGYTGFDRGGHSVEILCNASSHLSEKNINNDTGMLTYAESGHTSNIKDILAMCDIMFNNSLATNTDSSIDTYLGTSPAVLKYENFKTALEKGFKFLVGNTVGRIVGLFSNDNWVKKWTENTGHYLASYKTLLNYCTTLFEVSHQTNMSLELKYFRTVNKDGTDQTEASYMGYCSKPEIAKVKITSFNGKISPCSNTGGINLATVNTGENKPSIELKNAVDPNSLCLLSSYKSNKDTLDKIETKACWNKKEEQTEFVLESDKWILLTSTKKDGPPDIDKSEESLEKAKDEMIDSIKVKVSDFKKANPNQYIYTDHNNASRVDFDIPTDITKETVEWTMETLDAEKFLEKFFKNDKDEFSKKILSEVNCDDAINKNVKIEDIVVDFDGEYAYILVPLKDSYKLITIYHLSGSTKATKTKKTFTRECKKHEFYYCGGHLAAHVTGQVYSASQEQLDLIGGTNAQLVACNNDYEKNGIKIVGKINQETLDNSSAATCRTTGKGESMWFSINGTFMGMDNLNIITGVADNEVKWLKTNKTSTGYDMGRLSEGAVNNLYLARDIFDVDTGVLKGSACFPTKETSEFFGWTSDNMNLALMKMSQDWGELYGFDIPWNIDDSYTLNSKDINAVIKELQATYGSKFTAEREAVVRTALSQVGYGNYNNDGSHNHTYLCETHWCRKTKREDDNKNIIEIDWLASCTAGVSNDFTTFCYYTNNRFKYFKGVNLFNDSPKLASDYSNALPADIIVHKGAFDGKTVYAGLKKDGMYSKLSNQAILLANKTQSQMQDKSVIYIGKLDHDVKLTRTMWHKGKDNTTETFYTIPKNTPIYVTLDKASEKSSLNYGSVYLGGFDILGNTKDASNGRETYLWIKKPDIRTYVYSFNRTK